MMGLLSVVCLSFISVVSACVVCSLMRYITLVLGTSYILYTQWHTKVVSTTTLLQYCTYTCAYPDHTTSMFKHLTTPVQVIMLVSLNVFFGTSV